ncbi:14248_t:CDS:2 [Dentiscutata erythropus]|uniref:14248_t:CDS:1 n=1 Tax=Dentiscutata erythropus TaxID=1348616 RepID=A0A9N9GZK8_9GLOM|nr:14248_t:CDS:2 [Dentiscutata erythropus]
MTTKTAVDMSKKRSTMSKSPTNAYRSKPTSPTPKGSQTPRRSHTPISSHTPKRPSRFREASPTLSEKTDPDSEKSSSIISPIEEIDHHGSIEQAIKSIEEQLKLQQQKFAKRLLSRQHRPVEYRNDTSAPPVKSSSGRSRTEPFPQMSYSGKPMKVQTLPSNSQTKKVAPKTVAQIKNICTCGDPNSPWCHVCELRRFKSAFPKWTSGNKIVDNFIRETQLNSSSELNYLEWITYDRFREIKAIGDGTYAKLSSAVWLDGPRILPDEKKKFKREIRKKVILRELHNSQQITESFFINSEFALAENWRSHKAHAQSSQEEEKIHPLAFYNSQDFDFSELQSSQVVRYGSPDVDVKCDTPPSETENTFEPPQSPTESNKLDLVLYLVAWKSILM